MTDRFQEQISGFVDDELSADECEFFVRRLQRDSDSRRQLMRYHLIGAALRGELKHSDPDLLRRRLQGALSGVREPVARTPRRLHAITRPLVGLGIAATVAVVALFVLQTVNDSTVDQVDVANNVPLLERPSVPAAYVVPPDTDRRLVSPPIRLTNYLMHHSEYTSHLSRTSVHSNVVTTGQPELTNDEDAIR